MNEVEKMYSNAGVKYYKEICAIKNVIDKISNQECYFEVCCTSCPLNKTPFTAEKQLELIKWLAKRENLGCEEKIAISISEDDYCFVSMGLRILEEEQETYSDYCFGSKTFEIALAGLINCLWQDLTEEERKQIKEILSE